MNNQNNSDDNKQMSQPMQGENSTNQAPPPNQRGNFANQPPSPNQRGNFANQPLPPNQRGNFANQPPPPNQRGNFANQPPPPNQRGNFANQPPPPNQRGNFANQPPSPPMYGGAYGNQYNYAYRKPKASYNFTKSQVVFAWLSVLIGYLFVKFIMAGYVGISATIFCIVFLALSVSYNAAKGINQNGKTVFQLLILVLFSAVFMLTSNKSIISWNLLFLWGATLYWQYTSARNRESDRLDKMFFFDIIKAMFVMPFSAFGAAASAVFKGVKNTKFGRKFWLSILGLVMAIPVTWIVSLLLVNADPIFKQIFEFIFNDFFRKIVTALFQTVVGLPIALYTFGALYANGENKNKEVMTIEANEDTIRSFRICPNIVAYFAIGPVCFMYFLYFISQAAYFLSAFNNIVPEKYSYAQYARRGFFELCIVCVINVIIIFLMDLLIERENGKRAGLHRFYIGFISVLTLVIIATALRKMALYIGEFGLTPLRVYSSWFIILLGLVFIAITIRQFAVKFNWIGMIVTTTVIMFGILCFGDVDGQIAKYNVEMYQSGRNDEIDISMISWDLSFSAVEYVVPLCNDSDPKVAEDAKKYVERKERELDMYDDWRGFNFPQYRAKKAIADYKN